MSHHAAYSNMPWRVCYAGVDEEVGRVGDHWGRDKNLGNRHQGPSGAPWDRGAKTSDDTQRRGLRKNSGGKQAGGCCETGQYGKTGERLSCPYPKGREEKMKIMTARLGEVEIDVSRIITFPDGIIGFPDFKRYIELDIMEDSPIRLLQAVDTPDLGFFIVDPRLFVPEYIIDISQAEIKNLNENKPEDLEVKVIVTIPENPFDMTANLQGPLVIGRKARLAKQVVNSNQKYSTKHKVLNTSQESQVAQ